MRTSLSFYFGTLLSASLSQSLSDCGGDAEEAEMISSTVGGVTLPPLPDPVDGGLTSSAMSCMTNWKTSKGCVCSSTVMRLRLADAGETRKAL